MDTFLIVVNSDSEYPFNHYAAYVLAFIAKMLRGVPNVVVFYGPSAVNMVRKGELAKLTIHQETKNLIAFQLGINAADLPDNLEQLARYLVDNGVTVASCATFHVISGFAIQTIDVTNIEDFVTPMKLLDAFDALAGADKVHYL